VKVVLYFIVQLQLHEPIQNILVAPRFHCLFLLVPLLSLPVSCLV
jgi:hypothetical protein